LGGFPFLEGTSGGLARFHHSPVDKWSRLWNFSPNNSLDSGSAFTRIRKVGMQKRDNSKDFIAKTEGKSPSFSR
jgi:hypothetical protein